MKKLMSLWMSVIFFCTSTALYSENLTVGVNSTTGANFDSVQAAADALIAAESFSDEALALADYQRLAMDYFLDNLIADNSATDLAGFAAHLFPAFATDAGLADATSLERATEASTPSMGLALVVLCIAHSQNELDIAGSNESDDDVLERYVQNILNFYEEATRDFGFFFRFYALSDGTPAETAEIVPMDTAILQAGFLFAKEYMLSQEVIESDDQLCTDIENFADAIDWKSVVDTDDAEIELSFEAGGDSALRKEFYRGESLTHFMSIFDLSFNEGRDLWQNVDRSSRVPSRPYLVDSQDQDSDTQVYLVGHILSADDVEAVPNIEVDYIEVSSDNDGEVVAGLSGHLISQSVLDFRNKEDLLGVDYFLNSVRAVLANRTYAFDLARGVNVDLDDNDINPFVSYQMGLWGISEAFVEDFEDDVYAPRFLAMAAFPDDDEESVHRLATNDGRVVPSVTMAAINHAPIEVLRFFVEAQQINEQLIADNQQQILNDYGFVGSFAINSADVTLKVTNVFEPRLDPETEEPLVDAIFENPALTFEQKQQQLIALARNQFIPFEDQDPILVFDFTADVTRTVSALDKAMEVIMIENFLQEQDVDNADGFSSVWDVMSNNSLIATSERTFGIEVLAENREYVDSNVIGAALIIAEDPDADQGDQGGSVGDGTVQDDNDGDADGNLDPEGDGEQGNDDEPFHETAGGGAVIGGLVGASVGALAVGGAMLFAVTPVGAVAAAAIIGGGFIAGLSLGALIGAF